MEIDELLTIDDFRRQAARIVSTPMREFIDNGDKDGWTLRRNLHAFEQVQLNPSRLVEVSRRSLATEVLETQVSYYQGQRPMEISVRRAEQAGCSAICITVDIPLVERAREHDRRTGFRATQGRVLANYDPQRAVVPSGVDPAEIAESCGKPLLPFTLRELAWLRGVTDLPIVVKGILNSADARRCCDSGVDAVVVSNLRRPSLVGR